MKILYAAELSPNSSALYRLWALERLGYTIIPVNTLDYPSSNPVLRKITHRTCVGPRVDRLNRDLLRIAAAEKPDVLWADKVLWARPRTLSTLRKMGVATVSYMIDNPFGTRQDPGWRLYMKDIPFYDLHVVQRDRNIFDYHERGARDVIKIQTAYEPTLQYPPPADWTDANRDREVSFIGTPYDDRADTLVKLSQLKQFAVTISGNRRSWQRAIGSVNFPLLYREGELYQKQYREAIWRSKINLSFLTHSNQDEFVHKSFEVAACEGFLLAERSQGHLQRFREDEEAVFFSTFDELVQKIQRYLPDEAARARIAAAGCSRARRDGYHNDHQVELIVERVQQLVPKIKAAADVEAAASR
jgi:spore maturation protein CgeB